jgi:regulator of sigma E protease
MEGLIMTAQLLLSLSILIAVHEGGHFVAARVFGIKVEKFYLFFDFLFPMANVMNFSLLKFKKGDTEYGIGWFPLGGYVKIAGMVDESMDKEQMKKAPEPWEFRAKPAWQRLIVMLGGIIVNVVVGVLIFIGLTYFIGDTYIPKDYVNNHGGIQSLELGEKLGFKTGDKIVKINGSDFVNFQDVTKADVLLSENSYYTIDRGGQMLDITIPGDFLDNFSSKEAAGSFVLPRIEPIIGRIEKGGLVERIGLQSGDKFIEIEGQPITYHDELTTIAKSTPLDSISFKIQRGAEVLTFHEAFKEPVFGFYAKGISREALDSIQYGSVQSIGLGTKRAFEVIGLQLKAFGKIFTGELSFRKNMSGPIGMAQAFGTTWDWEHFWRMTGLLSMVLAFMNLLPIPALDGGYVVFLLYEMITGREPSEKFFENSLKVGMGLLLLLMVFVFYNDIAKLFVGG